MENRRKFLKGAGASLGLLAAAGQGAWAATPGPIIKSPNGKPLAGVFPIGWTPCKPDNRFDVDAMVKQQQFLNRGKVAGQLIAAAEAISRKIFPVYGKATH